MLTRRNLLKDASLVALAPTVPSVLLRTARAAAPDKDARALVVIQLDGGNDGINTVVPTADEGYAQNRQELRLASDRLRKVTDELALHPSLGAAAKLLEERRLAIVQGVGYPNPNRSHDVSMSIWQTARFDREDRAGYGWIGRSLDAAATSRGGSPDALMIGEGATPRALWGRRCVASSLSTLDDLTTELKPIPQLATAQRGGEQLNNFLTRATLDAYSTADLLADLSGQHSVVGGYPNTELSERLRIISRLIKADIGARVYYAVQPGYDTHSTQMPVHSRLLRELGDGLRAFLEDLRRAGLEDRVLVLCFSEFGRRVKENASAGTDHGTAGPMFLAGGAVRAGVHGATPSLLDLDEGDLKHTVDFRSVYATVMANWLGIDVSAALGGQFPKLDLLMG